MSNIPWTELEAAAIAARDNAYAPYSQFHVGAAIWAEGKVFTGCNVENASYPNGICAERVAVGSMVAAGVQNPEAIVIVAGPVVEPCGMCRQTLAEFASDIPIRMLGYDTGGKLEMVLTDLFPAPFKLLDNA